MNAATHTTTEDTRDETTAQPFFGKQEVVPFFQRKLQSAGLGVQRKCAHCEEEEKRLQRKGEGEAQGGPALESTLDSSRGGGQSLKPSVASEMGNAFGADFSDVRIHADGQAAQLSTGLNAQAFTYGQDVYFNSGKFDPSSTQGKHLLAHELTHVVQQGQAATAQRMVQRAAPAGFDIRGVNPAAASSANVIFFDADSAVIPPTEGPKIAALAAPAAASLTLTGTTSEEGTDANKLATVNNRIAAVRTALVGAGHTGPMVANPQPGAGANTIDYRSVRAVEVIPTPAVVPIGGIQPHFAPVCAVTAANPHPEVTACGTSFVDAIARATPMVTTAKNRLSAPDAAVNNIVHTLFPATAPATVLPHIQALENHLINEMPTRFQCHNTCDGGCTRPGFNNRQGAASMMTLCPDFINDPNLDNRAKLLIHEGLHGTTGVAAEDISYMAARKIRNMTTAQALLNTDSHVLLVFQLAGVAPADAPPVDATPGLVGTEPQFADRILSFLEQWMLNAEFDSSTLYGRIPGNIGRAGGWNHADAYYAEIMHRLSGLFAMTDSKPSPPPAPPAFQYTIPPTADDHSKMAGAFERYSLMRQALFRVPITFAKVATPESWQGNLSNHVSVNQAFFAMTNLDATRHLGQLMVHSMPTIPIALEGPYVEGANQMRLNRGNIGP